MPNLSNKVSLENALEVFKHHPPQGEDILRHERLRIAAYDFTVVVLKNCPDCADRTAAIRKIREALMTANAAVALEYE